MRRLAKGLWIFWKKALPTNLWAKMWANTQIWLFLKKKKNPQPVAITEVEDSLWWMIRGSNAILSDFPNRSKR